MNKYGWGQYSDNAYIIAAQVPGKPQAPVFVSSTNSSLLIDLNLDVSNGGLPILSYTLEINDGTENGPFIPVSSYDGISPSHTLDSTVDSLTTGLFYKLRFKATNVLGSGLYSNILKIALIDPPEAPYTPVRVDSASSLTSIGVDWYPLVDGPNAGGVVTGYNLYIAVGVSGSYRLAYSGNGYPTISSQII